jgi:hypothetical protein
MDKRLKRSRKHSHLVQSETLPAEVIIEESMVPFSMILKDGRWR